MRLSFDSIDEVKEFVKQLKGTRGPKGSDDDSGAGAQAGNVPALAMPQGNAGPTFVPQGPGAGPGAALGVAGAFPGGASGPVLDPQVGALVQRLNARIAVVIAGDPSKGIPAQPAEQVAIWLRGQCSPTNPNAAAATLEQLQNVFIANLGVPQLTEMARLMAA